ncbi:hypothetical protein Pint_17714 [Pistacia integerrima]|uniref:Uncharacterized protein n=1 Tax=Pistacia integerrima TaxID=434235 RepID=A0ACC0YYE7_9ROSI|nr:hypothetical protein Pint_17714 [Pistacia integerrima]
MTTYEVGRQDHGCIARPRSGRSRPNGAAQVAISQIASQSARPDHDVTGNDPLFFTISRDEGGVLPCDEGGDDGGFALNLW